MPRHPYQATRIYWFYPLEILRWSYSTHTYSYVTRTHTKRASQPDTQGERERANVGPETRERHECNGHARIPALPTGNSTSMHASVCARQVSHVLMPPVRYVAMLWFCCQARNLVPFLPDYRVCVCVCVHTQHPMQLLLTLAASQSARRIMRRVFLFLLHATFLHRRFFSTLPAHCS